MNLNKLAISRHFMDEHMERYVFIQMTTGIGKPILKLVDKERGHNNYITDTGVFLITDLKDECLISAYYATREKVYSMCKINQVFYSDEIDKVVSLPKLKGYIKKQKEIDKQERQGK